MKKLFIILVVLFSIISCKTDNGIDSINELGIGTGDLSPYGVFDKNYIGLWDKEESITFNDYYSQIDTVLISRVLSRDISYCYAESDSVSIVWKVNGVVYSGIETKKWVVDWQKWVSKNSINFDISGINNLEIEAIVTINGLKYRRFKTIPSIITKKHICDAFGLSFGTKQGDINGIDARSPTFAIAQLVSETGGLTSENYSFGNPIIYLEFSDSKLTKIHLLPNYSSDTDKFSNICHIPQKLTYRFDGSNKNNQVINSQVWNFGNLSFKVENVDINPYLGKNGNPEYYMFLTIQKQ